ncbi:MAG: hypothetical protein JNK82_35865 [Myxococcaceae bacterium]|nr:hypothetical protein [Myxococcaceae bacterium]
MYVLQRGYGGTSALRIDRQGRAPMAGQTYRVVLTGERHAPLEYDVKPIPCP